MFCFKIHALPLPDDEYDISQVGRYCYHEKIRGMPGSVNSWYPVE